MSISLIPKLPDSSIHLRMNSFSPSKSNNYQQYYTKSEEKKESIHEKMHKKGESLFLFSRSQENSNKNNTKSFIKPKPLPHQALSLNNRSLTLLPRNFLANYQNLLILEIEKNEIHTIPNEITELKSLEVLKLDWNKITSLPENLFKLPSLSYFSISNNFLSGLPNQISNWKNSIKSLNFAWNRLEIIPNEISQLGKLQSLLLNNNPLRQVPVSIQTLNNIREFSLEWFKYTNPKMSMRHAGGTGEITIKSLLLLLRNLSLKQISKCFFVDFFEHFSKEKFNIKYKNTKKQNYFHEFVLNDDLTMFEIFQQDFANDVPSLLEEEDIFQNTPISLAIKMQKTEITKFVLQNRPVNKKLLEPLLCQSALSYNQEIVKNLLEGGVNPNSSDAAGNNSLALMMPEFDKNAEISFKIGQLFLEYEIDPNKLNNEYWGPLHIAVGNNQIKAVKWMVEQNNQLDKQNINRTKFDLNKKGGILKTSALHVSAKHNFHEICKVLIENNADPLNENVQADLPINKCAENNSSFKIIMKGKQSFFKNWINKIRKKQNEDQFLVVNQSSTVIIKNAETGLEVDLASIPNPEQTKFKIVETIDQFKKQTPSSDEEFQEKNSDEEAIEEKDISINHKALDVKTPKFHSNNLLILNEIMCIQNLIQGKILPKYLGNFQSNQITDFIGNYKEKILNFNRKLFTLKRSVLIDPTSNNIFNAIIITNEIMLRLQYLNNIYLDYLLYLDILYKFKVPMEGKLTLIENSDLEYNFEFPLKILHEILDFISNIPSNSLFKQQILICLGSFWGINLPKKYKNQISKLESTVVRQTSTQNTLMLLSAQKNNFGIIMGQISRKNKINDEAKEIIQANQETFLIKKTFNHQSSNSMIFQKGNIQHRDLNLNSQNIEKKAKINGNSSYFKCFTKSFANNNQENMFIDVSNLEKTSKNLKQLNLLPETNSKASIQKNENLKCSFQIS